MLTHAQIWAAIDRLAKRHGLSASALAKKAGLDATSFNKSKRHMGDGRPRWPSTESIAKVLTAVGETVDNFVAILSENEPKTTEMPLPVIELANLSRNRGVTPQGLPAGEGDGEVIFPNIRDASAYAVEVNSHDLMPFYRQGDMLIVSPASPIRRGDRILVKETQGRVSVQIMQRRTAGGIECQPLDPAQGENTITAKDMEWSARIIWASQ